MDKYFISCEYEYKGSDYLKIKVMKNDEPFKIFESSDPIIVWYEYQKWYYTETVGNIVLTSSTMDHWFFDTENYKEEYFDPETFEFIDWRSQEMWDVDKKYPTCVIKNGMKNFQELKDYVKSHG